MKKSAHLAVTIILALGSAAIVAYSMGNLAHHGLGIPRSALREQALICVSIIASLVTIEFLSRRE
jgi:ABC-type enterochelin transport system permease subunit